MVKEKTARNVKIYQLVIAGMPQATVGRLFGLTRSAVWQIFRRYAKIYGWDNETETLDPVRIDKETKDFLTEEAKRLQTSMATIVRLAISQSIIRSAISQSIGEDEFLETGSLWKGGHPEKTPDVRVTVSQYNYINSTVLRTGYNKSQIIRLIIENYTPIEIDF